MQPANDKALAYYDDTRHLVYGRNHVRVEMVSHTPVFPVACPPPEPTLPLRFSPRPRILAMRWLGALPILIDPYFHDTSLLQKTQKLRGYLALYSSTR